MGDSVGECSIDWIVQTYKLEVVTQKKPKSRLHLSKCLGMDFVDPKNILSGECVFEEIKSDRPHPQEGINSGLYIIRMTIHVLGYCAYGRIIN